MMKKFLAIFLTLALALSLIACGQQPSDSAATPAPADSSSDNTQSADEGSAETIKVGVLLPNSGDSVNAGSRQRAGVEMYINNYNEAGGIQSMGGAKIEMIFADTTGKPDVGVTEMERLIQQQGVSVIIGPYNSAVGAATAPIAEKYQIPYMLVNSTEDSILQKGYQYTFRANHATGNNARAIVEMSMGLGEKKLGQKPMKWAIIAENTDWGNGTLTAVTNYLTQNYPDAEIVVSESYAANTADMSSIINKIKAANPDVVVPCSYVNDALLFTQQMADYKLSNTIVSSGSGFAAGDFIEKAGTNAEYIYGSTGWNSGLLAHLGDEAKAINEQYKALMGFDMDEFSANGYLGAAVVVDAIERAASSDPAAIHKAIQETDIKPGHPALALHPYKGVKFGELMGMQNQNIYSEVTMTQILNGEFVVVYPFEMLGDNNPAVYPAPDWSQR
jgi:branched-chain amino acid transport system substrate-binding protein